MYKLKSGTILYQSSCINMGKDNKSWSPIETRTRYSYIDRSNDKNPRILELPKLLEPEACMGSFDGRYFIERKPGKNDWQQD
jgi:hypothetical protein